MARMSLVILKDCNSRQFRNFWKFKKVCNRVVTSFQSITLLALTNFLWFPLGSLFVFESVELFIIVISFQMQIRKQALAHFLVVYR